MCPLADTYTTKQGDTFDIIALQQYNDEFQASVLMQANPTHISTVIFPAGIILTIPDIEDEAASTLPPWKRD